MLSFFWRVINQACYIPAHKDEINLTGIRLKSGEIGQQPFQKASLRTFPPYMSTRLGIAVQTKNFNTTTTQLTFIQNTFISISMRCSNWYYMVLYWYYIVTGIM